MNSIGFLVRSITIGAAVLLAACAQGTRYQTDVMRPPALNERHSGPMAEPVPPGPQDPATRNATPAAP